MPNCQDPQTAIDALTAEKQDLSARLMNLVESIAQLDKHAAQLLDKHTGSYWSLDENKHELVYDDKTSAKVTLAYTYEQLKPYLETIMAQTPIIAKAIDRTYPIEVTPTDTEPYVFEIADIKGVTIHISPVGDNSYHIFGYVDYELDDKYYHHRLSTKRPVPLEQLQDTIARIVVTLN